MKKYIDGLNEALAIVVKVSKKKHTPDLSEVDSELRQKIIDYYKEKGL